MRQDVDTKSKDSRKPFSAKIGVWLLDELSRVAGLLGVTRLKLVTEAIEYALQSPDFYDLITVKDLFVHGLRNRKITQFKLEPVLLAGMQNTARCAGVSAAMWLTVALLLKLDMLKEKAGAE